jgi:hypothetical protein
MMMVGVVRFVPFDVNAVLPPLVPSSVLCQADNSAAV